MIKLRFFNGTTREIDGVVYFYDAAVLVNEFLEQNDVEYVDCKYSYHDDIGDQILLIYRENSRKKYEVE